MYTKILFILLRYCSFSTIFVFFYYRFRCRTNGIINIRSFKPLFRKTTRTSCGIFFGRNCIGHDADAPGDPFTPGALRISRVYHNIGSHSLERHRGLCTFATGEMALHTGRKRRRGGCVPPGSYRVLFICVVKFKHSVFEM